MEILNLKPYVDEYGIYMPEKYPYTYRCVITKDVFIEAYNKWVKHPCDDFVGQDDADDWSED